MAARDVEIPEHIDVSGKPMTAKASQGPAYLELAPPRVFALVMSASLADIFVLSLLIFTDLSCPG